MSEALKKSEAESEARGKLLEKLRRHVGGDTWEQAVATAKAALDDRDELREVLSAVCEHSEYADGELYVDMERVAAVLEIDVGDAIGHIETLAWSEK